MSPKESPDPNGEDDRFHDLFEQNYRLVTAYLARLGCSPEERQDLAQETFLRAYKGIGAFRGEASATAWLLTIANNVRRNEFRARNAEKRRAGETSLEELTAESLPGDNQTEYESRIEHKRANLPSGKSAPLERILVSEAMDSLPTRMRRIALLRFGQDLKYREIAALLGMSIDTVKSHLHQARERLQTLLASEHFPDQPGLNK